MQRNKQCFAKKGSRDLWMQLKVKKKEGFNFSL